jgi:phosphatidylethanolamine/phosphatidyl-N-methylethanolamine N-methyltransferase
MQNNNPNSYYHDAYDKVMYTGTIGVYSKIVHTLMELGFNNSGKRILEVGAGRGEHFPYVKRGYTEYVISDIDKSLLENGLSNLPDNVSIIQADAEIIAAAKESYYDRVIATCLLAHLDHPIKALERWRGVTKHGGSIVIYVPNEPGMLLRLFRLLFVTPKSKKMGQDHMSMIARDHRNHYPAMRQYIKDVFKEDSIKRVSFPFSFLGWNFNFFTLYKVTVFKRQPEA